MLYVRGSSAAVISSQTINNNAQSTAAVTANASGLELWDQIDLTVTMGTSVTTGAPWVIYLVPDTVSDATAGTLTTPPSATYIVAQWPCGTGTSSQVFTAYGIALPPGEFTYVVYNNTGQNSSSTSVTMNRRPYHVA